MKYRLKTTSFWLELSGVLVLIFDAVSSLFDLQLYSDKVQDVVMTICIVLISLGFVTKKNINDTQNSSKEDLINEINEKNNK